MATIKVKKVEKKEEKQEITRQVNPSLVAIEKLTALSGALVEQVKELSSDLDDLKNRVTQVASRLGL